MANFEKIKEIIVEKLNCDPAAVNEGASFTDLGADSLDLVEIVMGFEEEFKMEISDEDQANIKTVGDVVKYIDAKGK